MDETPKKLPIGIQSFREMIEGGYLYVDKTRYIHRLVTGGKLYFLSRPRRFGKSVLVSTLEALFRGEQSLFEGCFIADRWEWKPRPVIRLDLLGIEGSTRARLESGLNQKLDEQAETNGVSLPEGGCPERFRHLILSMARDDRVAVLIDEYDKPILDYLDDPNIATANQRLMATFYAVLKSLEDRLSFVFLTGVSKFTGVSLFSDLNNLKDLTLHPDYAGIAGFTEEELDAFFASYLAGEIDGLRGDELRLAIREWYDGYSWDGQTRVYNPVSVSSLFDARRFAAHWFSTGTPKFLIELLRQRRISVPELAHLEINELSLEGFAPDRIDLISLLFQTGYLTIKHRKRSVMGATYLMGYPNREVEQSFLTQVLATYAEGEPGHLGTKASRLGGYLDSGDTDGFCEGLRDIFATIPYNIFIDDREAYYHTVVYLVLSLSRIRTIGEIQTNKGRIDAVLETDDCFYVLEFKLGTAAEALEQILTKDYAAAFRGRGKAIVALGIGLDPEQRNIGDWSKMKLI